MPDTSNQIIQTLEAIHNDIKAAKDTLKENNVELISNSTSTLSTEINKIPTAIKESDTLIGFNNGTMSINGNIVYYEKDNDLKKDNSIFLAVNGPDFKYTPPDKRFMFKTLDIPNPNATYEENTAAMMQGLDGVNITFDLSKMSESNCYYLLKSMYLDTVNRILINNKQNRNSKFIIKFPDRVSKNSDDYFDVGNQFILPSSDYKLYSNDGTLIEKVKTIDFDLSYCKNIKEVKCTGRLNINIDIMYPIIKDINDIYTNDKLIIYNELGEFTFNNVNNNNSTVNGKYYSNYNNETIADYSNNNSISRKIEIRVDDTRSDILGKLHNVKVLMNILQFIDIANMDGTKKYSFKQNKFIDASRFGKPNEIDYDFLGDYDGFNSRYLPYASSEVENAESFQLKYYTPKSATNSLTNLIRKDGYCYITNSKLCTDIKFLEEKSEYTIDLSLFDYRFFGDEFVKIFNKEITINSHSNYRGNNSTNPTLINLSPMYINSSINTTQPYEFKGLTIKTSIGISIGMYLASPYKTKFIDDSDNSNMENIETDFAVLFYNENIKTVKLTKNYSKSELYIPLSLFRPIYMDTKLERYSNNTLINPPVTPMKFILNNDTKIRKIEDIIKVDLYPIGILGPYTTDAFAKKYDKFIHILAPEDYPGLGTFDFEMYRLPLYNLDESKKYNYSKKVWEPVTALTDDSLSLSSIYPTEYSNYRDNVNSFGFEVKTEDN